MKWSGERMKRFLDQAVENLFPDRFSLVMATGIISVASYQLEMRTIARTLLAINIAAYVALWSLTLLRLARFLPRVISDLTSHARGPFFLNQVTPEGRFFSPWSREPACSAPNWSSSLVHSPWPRFYGCAAWRYGC
jgi:hypothetical protein